MSKRVSISLPEDVALRLENVASAKGMSAAEWATIAVRCHLLLSTFEEIRGEALADLASRGIRLTDDDVFELIS